jgi:F-type H+-transporting ATPase subunit epsilon
LGQFLRDLSIAEKDCFMPSSFNFELVSPERLFFSGQVISVVAPGLDGYFTVMAGHARFMSVLSCGIVEIALDSGEVKKIYVSGGFSDVNDTGLTILAEYICAVEDLNADIIAQQISSAENAALSAQTQEKKEAAQLGINRLKNLQDSLKFS